MNLPKRKYVFQRHLMSEKQMKIPAESGYEVQYHVLDSEAQRQLADEIDKVEKLLWIEEVNISKMSKAKWKAARTYLRELSKFLRGE